MYEDHRTITAGKTYIRKVYLNTVERIHDAMFHNSSHCSSRHVHAHRCGRQSLVFVLIHYYETTTHSVASKSSRIATMSPSLSLSFLRIPSPLFLFSLLFSVLAARCNAAILMSTTFTFDTLVIRQMLVKSRYMFTVKCFMNRTEGSACMHVINTDM